MGLKNLLEYVVPPALAFILGMYFDREGNGMDMDKVISSINWIREKGYKLLVRSSSGAIVGIITGEETYFDEENEVKRRRLEYYDLNGESKTEPRDGISRERGKVDLISDIEVKGGIALTQLTEQGKVRPLFSGQRAKTLQEELHKTKADLSSMKRKDEEFRDMKEDLNNKQEKISNLQQEKQDLEEDRENFRNVNENLSKENDRLRIRMVGLQEQINEYKRVLESLTDMSESREEDITKALKNAKERMKKIDDITVPEMEQEIKKDKEEEQ